MTMNEMGARAKTVARALANAGALKESALLHAAGALRQRREELLAANALDVQAGREAGMSRALLDRLSLTEARIQDMAAAVEEVAKSADPVGKTLSGQRLPNGLQLEKVTVPLGVIGIIYEARPNVTSDAAALCLKAGNAVILRGGKEAFHSNQAVVKVLREALAEGGLPADCVQLVEDTSRQSAQELMALTEYLDVLIPRGGAHPLGEGERPGAGDRNRRGQLSRLCGQGRRFEYGRQHHLQRQVLPALGVQRH